MDDGKRWWKAERERDGIAVGRKEGYWTVMELGGLFRGTS